MQQLLGLAPEQPVNGDPGPGGDQGADALGGHRRLDVPSQGALRPPLVKLLLQPEPPGAQLSGPLVLRPPGCSLLLVLQVAHAGVDVLEIRGKELGVDADLAGGLVDQVDSLVREQAFGDVPLAETGRGLQRLVLDLHLVVGFVAGPQRL